MGGMNRGLGSDNPLIVSSFHNSVVGQFLIVLALVVGLALAWTAVRSWLLRREPQGRDLGAAAATAATRLGAEPVGRLVLRLCFGVLWTFDGLLQLQASMPLGLPGGVFASAEAGAPAWVHRVVGVGITAWSNHPITAATSAVWIQLGIGIGLLVAPRGSWSRAAGGVSAMWGAVVWVFGEAFGGVFTPGASWLFGLPGAALFYVVAGALIALPEAAWRTSALGRRLLQVLGAFFVGMGVLQAWPGRATWVGRTSHGVTGLTAAMARQMTSVPQWSSTRAAVRWFASFDAAHGWGVNLLVVVLLVGVGVCLLIGTRRVAGLGVVVGVALCLATWLLVQDLGFFGGVGTDPNSMVPTASLLIVGYLALRYPATARADDEVQAADAPHPPWRTLAARSPAYLLQVTAAVLAGAIVVLGAAPMAVASLNPHADPILAEATNGTPVHADFPAFGFDLVDQEGRMVTLSSLHGHVVVLTFFDPVCTTDCPLIAQQLLTVDRELQGTTPSVVFVAIDANPSYRSLAAIRAFDAQEGLTHVANWRFLTGSLGDLNRLWIDYGVQVSTEVAGAMAAHADLIYVIDQHGNVRSQIASDPGATAATTSSLGSLVTSEVERVQGL